MDHNSRWKWFTLCQSLKIEMCRCTDNWTALLLANIHLKKGTRLYTLDSDDMRAVGKVAAEIGADSIGTTTEMMDVPYFRSEEGNFCEYSK